MSHYSGGGDESVLPMLFVGAVLFGLFFIQPLLFIAACIALAIAHLNGWPK